MPNDNKAVGSPSRVPSQGSAAIRLGRGIRTGNIGGRRLNALMPWPYLRNLTDQDLKALWAYLKTVKPVAHDVPREEVKVKDNPDIVEHPAAVEAPPAVPQPG